LFRKKTHECQNTILPFTPNYIPSERKTAVSLPPPRPVPLSKHLPNLSLSLSCLCVAGACLRAYERKGGPLWENSKSCVGASLFQYCTFPLRNSTLNPTIGTENGGLQPFPYSGRFCINKSLRLFIVGSAGQDAESIERLIEV
jgi:hypothetical protein